MPLTSDSARIITKAQSLHSAVRRKFPENVPREPPDLLRLKPQETAEYVLWLLGTKIPRLARCDRLAEAEAKLALAQGILLGAGYMSRQDVHIATTVPPRQPGQKRYSNVDFISLTV